LSLFEAEAFERFVAALPATSLHRQWESRVAKVGGKVFALRGDDSGSIVFKVAETTFEILTPLAGIDQAPYFAKRQWVRVQPDAELPDADLAAYVAASHRMIAARLTRKLQAELGLSTLLASDDTGRR
jgi:predicted DNA-binding protein (MmcQ/YjbR family)